MASVPMPQPAPQAKDGEAPPEKPKTIASLLGNMFGGSNAQAEPAESQTVVLRGTHTEMAAKPKQPAAFRTASVPAASHAKTTTAEPAAVAKAVAKMTPPVQQARKDAAAAPEMRTASSAPPVPSGGLLTGAQPVVPAGSFESRWTAVR
jgi:hypothetical protein